MWRRPSERSVASWALSAPFARAGLRDADARVGLGARAHVFASSAGPSAPPLAAATPTRLSSSRAPGRRDRPRSSATSSGVRRLLRPSTVAFTRLIGFCEPEALGEMSWIPGHARARRGPPPPGDHAGTGSSRLEEDPAAPNTPVVSWVIVRAVLGHREEERLFWPARRPSGSRAEPRSPCHSRRPTISFSSPTTTSAVNENRRPP